MVYDALLLLSKHVLMYAFVSYKDSSQKRIYCKKSDLVFILKGLYKVVFFYRKVKDLSYTVWLKHELVHSVLIEYQNGVFEFLEKLKLQSGVVLFLYCVLESVVIAYEYLLVFTNVIFNNKASNYLIVLKIDHWDLVVRILKRH